MTMIILISDQLTILIVIDKVLSPGGSLRLLAASLPGLGRLLVDNEDLHLVRVKTTFIRS